MDAHGEPAETVRGVTRRRFLRGAGAVTVLVAGGGVWRATSRGVFSAGRGPAFEPWTTWRTDQPAGPMGLVRAGILAANPHNTQPWLFRVGAAHVDLLADTGRHLGTMDPFLREMHLGLGCAVENMVLAAAAGGYAPTVEFAPGTLEGIPAQPAPTLVARITLAPGERRAPDLYRAIPDRHTNRGPYDAQRPVPREHLETLRALAETEPDVRVVLLSSERDREAFATATVQATRDIVADATMAHDSHAWFRMTWRDVQTHRDGPTIDAAMLPPLLAAVVKMLPPMAADAANAGWVRATETVHCATAPVFGLIAVRQLYDRPASLRAGRAWQRLHLWGATQGLAMQPLNQIVEMVDRERQLHRSPEAARMLEELTGDAAWKPTFAFRVGYPLRPAGPSPRRAVDAVVV